MTDTSSGHFDRQYQTPLKYLKVKGLHPRPSTPTAPPSGASECFDQQNNDLSEAQLTKYFSDLIGTHS